MNIKKYLLEKAKQEYEKEIKAGTFSGSFTQYKKEFLQGK